MTKKKPVAPEVRTDEPRTRLLKVQLPPEEFRRLRMAAAAEDLKVSEFVRQSLSAAATIAIRRAFPESGH